MARGTLKSAFCLTSAEGSKFLLSIFLTQALNHTCPGLPAETAQQVNVPTLQPDNPSSVPGLPDSQKLTSDLQAHDVAFALTH